MNLLIRSQVLYSIELRGRRVKQWAIAHLFKGCKYRIKILRLKNLFFVDLAGDVFDDAFGEEPGEGGAEFVDEAGDDLGLAGEHCVRGEAGDGLGGHVEAFGRFEAFGADLGAVGEVGIGSAGADAGDGDGSFVELLMKAAAE